MFAPPLVILEGPDEVGKTTLGLFLAREFESSFFHATAAGQLKVAMMDYQSNILDNVETSINELKRGIILDRHWPSEVVYGSVFRPENPNNFSHDAFVGRIKALGGIYVFCDHPDVIERHARNRDPLHPYEDANFRRVVEGYRLLNAQLSEKGFPILDYSIPRWGSNMRDFSRLIRLKHHELTTTS